jgi:hypothetical protein
LPGSRLRRAREWLAAGAHIAAGRRVEATGRLFGATFTSRARRAVEAAQGRRLELAQSLRAVVRDAETSTVGASSRVNRAGVAGQAKRLLALADWLEDLERPTSERGLQYVERLLSDSSSTLHDPRRAEALPLSVNAALVLLGQRC